MFKLYTNVLVVVETDLKNRLELPMLSESPRSSRAQIDVPYLSLFPAENVYESAAKLLFIAIKWARTIPSFLQVGNTLFTNSSIIKLSF